MAIGKKRKTRKTGAKKRKARVGAKAASPKTRKFNGETFTKLVCGVTKAVGGKRAASHKSKGTTKKARVVKNDSGKGWCVYARG